MFNGIFMLPGPNKNESGSLREFSIFSDIKYGAHGAFRSTIENLSNSFDLCDNFIEKNLILNKFWVHNE